MKTKSVIVFLSHKALLCILLLFGFLQTMGQTDSTQTETYDIIYLKDGQTLKGQIIVFEEEDGDIIFKSLEGLTYSLSRKDYTSFKENVEVQRNAPGAGLRARKETEFEFSLGFSASLVNIRPDFKPDDYYWEQGTGSDAPLAFRLGAGKYLNRQNFLGITCDIAFVSDSKNYFSAFARYCSFYSSNKKNVALYLPVEIGYNQFSIDSNYGVKIISTDQQGNSYTNYTSRDIETSFSSAVFNLGQGLSIAMNDKKSIAFELSIFKNFFVHSKFLDLQRAAPKTDFKVDGLKLMIIYNI